MARQSKYSTEQPSDWTHSAGVLVCWWGWWSGPLLELLILLSSFMIITEVCSTGLDTRPILSGLLIVSARAV